MRQAPVVQPPVQMTPEQQRRHQLQIDWLISALARQAERRLYQIDERSLSVGRACPMCGAKWLGGHQE